MKLLAIDPGTTKSAYVVYDGKEVLWSGTEENPRMLDVISTQRAECTRMTIEMVQGLGMPVGQTTFETVYWIGRFVQHWDQWAINGRQIAFRIFRKEIKHWLCGVVTAKDKNIRVAVQDRFEPYGGGKNPYKGTKKEPGPLYGIKEDEWQALALAVTYFERMES